MPGPVLVAEDRTIRVPKGQVVRTGYASADRVRLACTDRMAIGDVERAYRRRIQLDGDQPWPPPTGYWLSDVDGAMTFVLEDGRHEFVAALMLGYREILVAWVEPTA